MVYTALGDDPVVLREFRSSGLSRNDAGAVGLGGGDRLMPRLGLRRGQRGEYLLLVAFDALQAGHDRD
jgi:hypothetical protein